MGTKAEAFRKKHQAFGALRDDAYREQVAAEQALAQLAAQEAARNAPPADLAERFPALRNRAGGGA